MLEEFLFSARNAGCLLAHSSSHLGNPRAMSVLPCGAMPNAVQCPSLAFWQHSPTFPHVSVTGSLSISLSNKAWG